MDIPYVVKREMLRRKYSNRTINSYLYCINRFFKKCNKDISKISKTDVREYLNDINTEEKSGNTINVNLNALKFFFEQILHKRMKLDIIYSKVPKNLSITLTKEEVKKLIDSIKNPKHKLMIQLMYGSGLRVSELINLKIDDLDLEKGYGWVRKGKGNKDRLFIIPNSLKINLKELVTSKKINEYNYLFTSLEGNKYSIRSPQQIIKQAGKKAFIKKRISCHTLRHSFATHLIEEGYSISEVQALLGHKSPETTFVYVHTISSNMIKVKSPLDSL